jgi:hypothetical protein
MRFQLAAAEFELAFEFSLVIEFTSPELHEWISTNLHNPNFSMVLTQVYFVGRDQKNLDMAF